MNRQTPAVAAAAFLAGLALAGVLAWSPAGWAWADRLLHREHAGHVHETAPGTGRRLWTCSMHPQVVRDQPGPCPICHMALTPIEADPSPIREGDAAETGVRVSPNFLQNFNVRTVAAERGAVPIEIRTVGVLEHDEERLTAINVKYSGWIEKARANNRGEHVRKGDVLFEIYSPELVAAQREYLATLDYAEGLSAAAAGVGAIKRARALVEAARERFRAWDFPEERIRALERNREVARRIPVHSPVTGVVFSKSGQSLDGMRVTPGTTVLEIALHDRLWVLAQIHERDLRHVRLGQTASVEVDAFPGRVWSGRVAFFDPALDPRSRTLTARIGLDNRDLRLAPQMYASVTFRGGTAAEAVVVPDQAVVRSGERAVLIVRKPSGLFEPREVALGNARGGRQEILSGLEAGEIVVVSSQFLIDSESNLRAAVGQLLGGEDGAAMPPGHQH